MVGGITVITLVQEAYPAKKGDWILVHAAAGGTGQLLGQVLRDIGAHTIGTVSSAEKGKVAREVGYEHVIETYDYETVLNKVKELTDNDGVICVYDGVPSPSSTGSLSSSVCMCLTPLWSGRERYVEIVIGLPWSTRTHGNLWQCFGPRPTVFPPRIILQVFIRYSTYGPRVCPNKRGV